MPTNHVFAKGIKVMVGSEPIQGQADISQRIRIRSMALKAKGVVCK